MKKVFSVAVLISCFSLFLGQAFAATTYFKGAFIQNIGYNNNVIGWENRNDFAMFAALMAVSDLGTNTITKQEITSTYDINLLEVNNGIFPEQRYFQGLYFPWVYDFSNLSTWETTYNFSLEWNDGSAQSHTDSVTINPGELVILDIPTFTMTGNILTWDTVASADWYRISVFDSTEYFLTATPSLTGNSYEFTGEMVPGEYIIRMEAMKANATTNNTSSLPYSSRSIYYDKITVTATPIPNAFFLLGSGLIGLVGIKNRKN